MNKILLAGAGLLTAVLLAGCASAPSPAELDQQTLAMLKASFRDQGIATMDRLN